jgi:putative Holliday junction resolvase
MVVIAIDHGRRRIGIATTGEHKVVVPVATVEERSLKLSVEAVAHCLAQQKADLVIVGLPLNMDGTRGSQALAAERFADELRLTTGLTVELFDERLTSFEARERLRNLPDRRKRGPSPDAVAACVILESWLQNRKQ